MVETCGILIFTKDFVFSFLFKAVQDFPDAHHALQLVVNDTQYDSIQYNVLCCSFQFDGTLVQF